MEEALFVPYLNAAVKEQRKKLYGEKTKTKKNKPNLINK